MTVIIGGIVGLLTSFVVASDVYLNVLKPFDGMEIIGILLYYLGFALVFAFVSLAGFLAYLFIHRFGIGIFHSFWPYVQMMVLVLAVFDILYFSNKDILLSHRIMIVIVLIVASIIVAYIKMKQTNKTGFIPAMFFMVVVTTLELTLGLRTSSMDYIIIILVTLLATNSYQLISWHHVTKVDPEHAKRIAERRKARREKIEKAKRERLKKEQKQLKTKNDKK